MPDRTIIAASRGEAGTEARSTKINEIKESWT
jgi:hypothetical protein